MSLLSIVLVVKEKNKENLEKVSDALTSIHNSKNAYDIWHHIQHSQKQMLDDAKKSIARALDHTINDS